MLILLLSDIYIGLNVCSIFVNMELSIFYLPLYLVGSHDVSSWLIIQFLTNCYNLLSTYVPGTVLTTLILQELWLDSAA